MDSPEIYVANISRASHIYARYPSPPKSDLRAISAAFPLAVDLRTDKIHDVISKDRRTTRRNESRLCSETALDSVPPPSHTSVTFTNTTTTAALQLQLLASWSVMIPSSLPLRRLFASCCPRAMRIFEKRDTVRLEMVGAAYSRVIMVSMTSSIDTDQSVHRTGFINNITQTRSMPVGKHIYRKAELTRTTSINHIDRRHRENSTDDMYEGSSPTITRSRKCAAAAALKQFHSRESGSMTLIAVCVPWVVYSTPTRDVPRRRAPIAETQAPVTMGIEAEGLWFLNTREKPIYGAAAEVAAGLVFAKCPPCVDFANISRISGGYPTYPPYIRRLIFGLISRQIRTNATDSRRSGCERTYSRLSAYVYEQLSVFWPAVGTCMSSRSKIARNIRATWSDTQASLDQFRFLLAGCRYMYALPSRQRIRGTNDRTVFDPEAAIQGSLNKEEEPDADVGRADLNFNSRLAVPTQDKGVTRLCFSLASLELHLTVPELLDDTKAAVGPLSLRELAPLSWSLDPPRSQSPQPGSSSPSRSLPMGHHHRLFELPFTLLPHWSSRGHILGCKPIGVELHLSAYTPTTMDDQSASVAYRPTKRVTRQSPSTGSPAGIRTLATREGGKVTDGEVLQANAALDIGPIGGSPRAREQASRGEPSIPRLRLPQLGRVPVPTEEVSGSQPKNAAVAKEDENGLDVFYTWNPDSRPERWTHRDVAVVTDVPTLVQVSVQSRVRDTNSSPLQLNIQQADAPTAPAFEVIESDSPVMGRKNPELGSEHLSGTSVTPQTPPRDSYRSYLPEINMSPIISESPLAMNAIISALSMETNIATASTSLPVPAAPISTPPKCVNGITSPYLSSPLAHVTLQNATVPPSSSQRAPLTYVSYNSMPYAQGASRASVPPPEPVRPRQRPSPQMLSPRPVSDTTLVSPRLSGSMQQTAKFSAAPPACSTAPLMRSSSLRAGLGIKSLFHRTERFSTSTSNPLSIAMSPMGPEEVARRKRTELLKCMIGGPIPIGLGVEGIGLGVSIASVGDLTMIGSGRGRGGEYAAWVQEAEQGRIEQEPALEEDEVARSKCKLGAPSVAGRRTATSLWASVRGLLPSYAAPLRGMDVIVDVVKGEGKAGGVMRGGGQWPLWLVLGDDAIRDVKKRLTRVAEALDTWQEVGSGLSSET
ncbi:hypothetical protein BV25DRAFT_1841365 [Artomyces pyxidatus]|uniref:Uncharacterized protein n=1 Tax=Artomyces pyxidatus TaxID=48021 RepID=A0ACB8SNV7_9AGAM|nr:hypothetical protein BV25DRAFT_1841365 [Artomyces pyxidatus]